MKKFSRTKTPNIVSRTRLHSYNEFSAVSINNFSRLIITKYFSKTELVGISILLRDSPSKWVSRSEYILFRAMRETIVLTREKNRLGLFLKCSYFGPQIKARCSYKKNSHKKAYI